MDELPIRWDNLFSLSIAVNILHISVIHSVCNSISVNFTAGDVSGRCKCFQECDMTTYDLQISTAAFPSNFLLQEIEEQLNVSEKLIRFVLLSITGDKF